RLVQLEDLLDVLIVERGTPEILPADVVVETALPGLLERALELVVREDLVADEVDLLDARARSLPDVEVDGLAGLGDGFRAEADRRVEVALARQEVLDVLGPLPEVLLADRLADAEVEPALLEGVLDVGLGDCADVVVLDRDEDRPLLHVPDDDLAALVTVVGLDGEVHEQVLV